MPSPNPRRDLLLKYLRHSFPYELDFKDWEGVVHPYQKVKDALYSIRDNNPEIVRIMTYHLYTRLPRTRVAEEVGYDPSTVKRKLDQGADLVMQRLSHEDFPPVNQFTIKDLNQRMYQSAFPVTFHRSW
jgi:hypothetical protein